MAYLESLTTSELMKYLKTERKSSSSFKKVEEILISREEKINNRANGLEKNLEMFKCECSELKVALQEKEKQNKNVESKLKEAELNKELCDNLKKTTVQMKENCKKSKERMELNKELCDNLKKTIVRMEEDYNKSKERIVLLEDEVNKINRNKEEVVINLNAEISDLKCGKARVEDERQIYNGRCLELETRLMQLGKEVSDFKKELEIYKCKCSELTFRLEKKENHIKAVESKLEELQRNKVLCDKFVSRMENDCKMMKQRIHYLEDVLNKTNRVKEEALNFLNAKISDLMGGKGRIEYELDVEKGRCTMLETQLKELGRVASDMNNELQIYKTKCSDLCRVLEEKVKEKTVVEANVEELEANTIALKGELNKYELACKEQKEIIAQMEKDYNVSKEQEKWAAEMIAFLEEELDKTNNDNKEVVIKLTAENSELKYGKREVQDELEVQKKRCREFSIALEKEKQKKGFEAKLEELEASKMLCEELKGVVACLEEDCKTAIEREKMVVKRNLFLEVELHKINNANDEVIVKLNADKGRVENELEAQMQKFKELETRITKLQIEVIELISELTPNAINRKGKNDAGEQTKVQNINRGLSEFKVKEKTGSCDEMVLDSADVDSHCSFPDIVSGGGEQVKGPTSVDIFSNLDSVKEHKVSKPDSDMENRSRRKMVFQSTGATYRKLASPKLNFENVTRFGDSEKKLVVRPKKKISDNIVKTTSSNQKGKETASGRGDRHSSVLPLKRKRTLKIVCSDSDEDDDHISLAERKMQIMKKDSVIHRHSS